MRVPRLAVFAILVISSVLIAPSLARAQAVPDMPTGSGLPVPQNGPSSFNASAIGPVPGAGAWIVGVNSPLDRLFARWLGSFSVPAIGAGRPAGQPAVRSTAQATIDRRNASTRR